MQPVLTLTPTQIANAEPASNQLITATLNPAAIDMFIDWSVSGGTLQTAQGSQTQNWLLPTAPGTYTITGKTFWRRFGNYAAPAIPSPVGGQVETVQKYTYEAGYDHKMRIAHPVYTGMANFDGYNLVVGLDNGDAYYIYIYWNGSNWRISPRQYIGGSLTILGDFGNIANGELVEIRVVGNIIECYNASGRFYFFDVSLPAPFAFRYNPAVTGVSSYAAPAIISSSSNPVTQTAIIATADAIVSVPAITGVATLEAGKQATFSVGSATGGSWATTAGTINAQGVFTAPCGAQSVTISYLVGQNTQSKVVQITPIQPINAEGNFASTFIGNPLTFSHSSTGGVWSADRAGMNASTGVFTPQQAGLTTITYTVNSCTVQAQIQVYTSMVVTPNQGANAALKLQRDGEVIFLTSGGSGQETFSSTCAGSLTQDGRFTAPPFASSCAITILDRVTGQVITIPIVIEASPGICITPVIEELLQSVEPELCCDYQTDCGDGIQLAVPGISVSVFARGKIAGLPAWRNPVLVVRSEPFAQLTAIAPSAGATADIVPAGSDGRIDVVVTPSMISSQSISAWGFSAENVDSLYSSIDYALGVNASGQVEVWEQGVSLGIFGAASNGMTLSVELAAGKVIYRRSGFAVYTSQVASCGDLMVDISLGAQNVTIGGAANAAWSLISDGNANDIGTISASGRYQSPDAPGLFMIEADVAGSKWRVNVRVTQPAPYISNPLDMWYGSAELWINTAYVPFGEMPILALNGAPDRGNSPNALNLGETKSGVKLKVEIEKIEQNSDRGVIAIVPGKEKASLTGDMLEVRNTRKLAALFAPSTIRNVRGGTQIGIGGKNCFCETTATLVKPAPLGCGVDGRYDTIQLHRVSAFSSGFEWDFATNGQVSLPFELSVLPDRRRPSGDQLLTVTFAKDCLQKEGNGC